MKWTSTDPTILVRSRNRCLNNPVRSSFERAETRDQWTINNDDPTSPMCALAQQVCFRLAPLPTSKFAWPQLRLAVALWCPRETSSVLDSVDFQGEWRQAQPIKKMLEAISRREMMANNQGGSVKRNDVLLFKATCRFVLSFSFYFSNSQQNKDGRRNDRYENTEERRTGTTNQHNNQLA